MEDQPLLETRGEYQHWLGIALILLGIYFVGMELIIPVLDANFPELHIYYRIEKYLRPTIVAVLLIGGGIKLLARPKRRDVFWSDEEI